MSKEAVTHFIGVDGGGTGCRVAIADVSGRVLARASGGAANYATDPALSIRNITATIEVAVAQISGEGLGGVAAYLGLAGVMSERDVSTLEQAFPDYATFAGDDRLTSVTGALGDRDGALASIGTGTILAYRRASKVGYVGGWGAQLSDQASGGWLGRALLRRAMLCHDGISEHSDLTRQTLQSFSGGPNEAVKFSLAAKPGDFARYAQEVIAAAKSGDPIGVELMQKGAAFVDAALARFDLGGDDVVCLAGGVGPHYADYLDAAHQARIRPAMGTALDGALQLARQAFEQRMVQV